MTQNDATADNSMSEELEPLLIAMDAEATRLRQISDATRDGITAGKYPMSADVYVRIGSMQADMLQQIVKQARLIKARGQ